MISDENAYATASTKSCVKIVRFRKAKRTKPCQRRAHPSMSVESQATVWITGAAGRMGRTISARLDHNRYRVVTTDRELDIVDLQRSLAFAESERPSFVINCAALASRTEAEANPDRAYQVNALGARNLAIASASVGATLYLSTGRPVPRHVRAPLQRVRSDRPAACLRQVKACWRTVRVRAQPPPHHRALVVGLHRRTRRHPPSRFEGEPRRSHRVRAREPVCVLTC